MRVAIISISDTRSIDSGKEDVSGTLLKDLVDTTPSLGPVEVSHYQIIPDEFDRIVSVLNSCQADSDLILTTGGMYPKCVECSECLGTGFAPRDNTPEATKSVIEKECPGIVTALLMRSLQATPFGALSRLASGIVGRTLIVNLPGSPKAVRECFDVLVPILPHAISLIKDEKETVQKAHESIARP